MPANQAQLVLDDLVTAAVVDETAASGVVSDSTLATAGLAAMPRASSPSNQGNERAVRTESTDVLPDVVVPGPGGAATRSVVRRLDNGLRRIEVLLERARAEQRMADATAAQAAHEAAKLATRTKVPIEIIAARAGIPVATISARREILDQRHRRP